MEDLPKRIARARDWFPLSCALTQLPLREELKLQARFAHGRKLTAAIAGTTITGMPQPFPINLNKVIFESHRGLPNVQKDVIPAINLINVAYEFTCECDAHYVGRTSQRLIDRMRQHVLLAIRKGTDGCNSRIQPKRKCKANQAKPESDSAIGTNLMSGVEW